MASDGTNTFPVADRWSYGWLALGAFLGLVIGMMLINQVIFRENPDYRPNKSNCFSCGRCMDYCPVGKEMMEA